MRPKGLRIKVWRECLLTSCNNAQVAVKLYHKQKLSELNHFQVAREITIHSSLDHKNIIQLVSPNRHVWL